MEKLYGLIETLSITLRNNTVDFYWKEDVLKNYLIGREFRKYLYGVAVAFIPFAIYKGWMDIEASPLIIALVVAIFNLSPKEEIVDLDEGPEEEQIFLVTEEPYLGKHGITEGAQLPKNDQE